MPKNPQSGLARELVELKRRLRALETKPRLGASSLDNETLILKDEFEREKGRIGRQPDGSHGSRVVESPPQPTPSAPVLRAGKAGVVMVRWDGNADGPVPLIHGHVEVVAAGPSSAAEVVSTIRDRDGGGTSFVADEAGTWSVHLVMVGQDRVTRSEPSEVSTIEVSLPVDGDAIQADIDQAKQDLADAEAEWEQARQGLRSDLDTLNDTTIPALESDLTTAQQNVDTIQNTTIPAVEQNLSDAEAAWEQSKTDLQSGLDQINNETIPVIRDDVDANATAITQAAQDAQAEYDRLEEIAEQALAGAPNVIYDPSFETDWYQRAWNGGELTVSTGTAAVADPPEGVQILRVANNTGGQVGQDFNLTPVSRKGDTPTNAVVDLDMSVRTGQVWRFEVQVRALVGGFDGTMRLRCNEGGTVNNIAQTTFTPTQEWEWYTLDVEIPQGINRVYWRFQPTIISGGFFADQVSVKNVTDFKAALDAAEAAAQAAQDAHDQAGEAKTIAEAARDTANQANRILSSTEPPTGTADEGVRWEQYEDFTSWRLVGTWIMQDGSWQKTELDATYIPLLDASVISTGKLGAARIDVASLYADTGFIDAFHAETVEAMRVTAETGFIGGVHLADNSIGARQVIASEVAAEVGTFVEIDAGQVITGKLRAGRIDVQSLYANIAFLNNLHAEAVEAMRVTAETGFIGGVLLADGAITTPKLTVTSDMTAAIAEFLEVKAVHIDANDIVTNSALVGELEAHGITLSAEVTNRRFQVSGQGWELVDTSTGQVIASLGVNGDLMLKSVDTSGRMSEMSGAGFRTEAADGTVIFDSRGSIGLRSTAFGHGAEATANNSTALGFNTDAFGVASTALGSGADAVGSAAVSIGLLSSASKDNSVAIGSVAIADGVDSIAVGTEAASAGDNTTAVGRLASAGGNVSTALGMEANATHTGATALGYQSEALNNYGTALGYQASATGSTSTALGPGSSATGFSSVAIGRGATAPNDNEGVLGASGSTTVTSNWRVPGNFNVDGNVGGDGLVQSFPIPLSSQLGSNVQASSGHLLMRTLAVVHLVIDGVSLSQGSNNTALVNLKPELTPSTGREWSGGTISGFGFGGVVTTSGEVRIRWSGGSSTGAYCYLTLVYAL